MCQNAKTYACPLFFAFFFFQVEKLAPVRLLPAPKATSLVMVKSFAISKENCRGRGGGGWGKKISLFAYYQSKLETVTHSVSFLSIYIFNTVVRVKISFLNYCYCWHNLMLLFSVPDKEIRERGKILYLI